MTYVYALLKGKNIVYVGQTRRLKQRLQSHKCKRSKISFTGYRILEECLDSDAIKRERFYIKKLTADGIRLINKVHASDNKLDNIDKRILELIADNHTTKTMHKIIWLSPRSIETRIRKIKRVYGAKTLGGLIYKAYKKGDII